MTGRPVPGRVAFIAAADGHFASDHLPLVIAAREIGLLVDVIVPPGPNRAAIENAGARTVALPVSLDSVNPMRAGFAAGQLAAALKRIEPRFVHCVGLGPSLVGGAACAMAGLRSRIYDLRGLGDLPFRDDGAARVLRRVARLLLGGPLRSRETRFLFSSEAGSDFADPKGASGAVVFLPDAGIDPELLRPILTPSSPPLRVAVLEATGAGVAAEAAELARSAGAAIDVTTLRALESREWPESVWSSHHVACFLTGEAKAAPRALLEAAACGRPIICHAGSDPNAFVRDGVEGLVVPSGDAAALAQALGRLVRDPVLLPRMGAAARARVLHGFTERDMTERTKEFYAAMLAGTGPA